MKTQPSIAASLLAATIASVAAIGCRTTSTTTAIPPMFASSISTSNRTTSRKLMERYFIDGSLLEMRERYSDAIREYRRALRFDSSSAVFYAIAKCYRQMGENDSALTFAHAAVESDSSNMSARLQFGELLLETGRFRGAVETFEEIVRIQPDNLEVRYLLARLLHSRNPQRAIVHYEYIVRHIPDDVDALLNLSELYLNRRDYARAVDALARIQRIRPESYDIYGLLIDAYVDAERFDDAHELTREFQRHIASDSLLQEFYDKELTSIASRLSSTSAQPPQMVSYAESLADDAARRFSRSWTTRLRSGIVFDRLGQYGRADSLIGSALSDPASTVDAWMTTANTLIVSGQEERAYRALAPTASRYDDARVPYYLGLVCRRIGMLDSAETLLKRSVSINANNAPAWAELGGLYNKQGRIGLSEAAYEKAISYDPDNADYLNNYAYVLAESNLHLDHALELIKRALDSEPENEAFLDTMGWIYFKLEDYDRALEYIRRSVDIGGANSDVIEHLGDVYRARGDAASARDSYERALRIAPGNLELRKKLEAVK